jgi:hypothetical protein
MGGILTVSQAVIRCPLAVENRNLFHVEHGLTELRLIVETGPLTFVIRGQDICCGTTAPEPIENFWENQKENDAA